MYLQRREFKRFIIHRSNHGLGAFAAQKIAAGDPIGEYVGELFEDVEHKEQTLKHSGLNYIFGLKETRAVVDGQFLGNPTHFLNDSVHVHPNGPKSKPANCMAREGLVNGDRRLIILAGKNIKKGEELFLDYGEKYWEND
ncbi:hypothetical protein DFH09DRAFT_1299721 [Mycena vulgaris]|nr:hypothetical protein DFH09DRAFT_1299721 [Mycena vulgaris]